MIFRLLTLLAAVAPYAFADVEFTSPSAGASAVGGELLQIAWKDSGTAPPITQLQSYQLFLCAGGNDAGSFVSIGCSRTNDIKFIGHFADTGTRIIDSVDPTGDQWSVQLWKLDDRINTRQHWSECEECIVRVYFWSSTSHANIRCQLHKDDRYRYRRNSH